MAHARTSSASRNGPIRPAAIRLDQGRRGPDTRDTLGPVCCRGRASLDPAAGGAPELVCTVSFHVSGSASAGAGCGLTGEDDLTATPVLLQSVPDLPIV